MCSTIFDHKQQKEYVCLDDLWNAGIPVSTEFVDPDYNSSHCFCWGIDLEAALTDLDIPFVVYDDGAIDLFPK